MSLDSLPRPEGQGEERSSEVEMCDRLDSGACVGVSGAAADPKHSVLSANQAQEGSISMSKAGSPSSREYKGVSWHTRRNSWVASITLRTVPRMIKHIGYFENQMEAVRAYDHCALDYRMFDKLNFRDYPECESIPESNLEEEPKNEGSDLIEVSTLASEQARESGGLELIGKGSRIAALVPPAVKEGSASSALLTVY